MDPLQLASDGASWSGSTVFSKKDKLRYSRPRVKSYKMNWFLLEISYIFPCNLVKNIKTTVQDEPLARWTCISVLNIFFWMFNQKSYSKRNDCTEVSKLVKNWWKLDAVRSDRLLTTEEASLGKSTLFQKCMVAGRTRLKNTHVSMGSCFDAHTTNAACSSMYMPSNERD